MTRRIDPSLKYIEMNGKPTRELLILIQSMQTKIDDLEARIVVLEGP